MSPIVNRSAAAALALLASGSGDSLAVAASASAAPPPPAARPLDLLAFQHHHTYDRSYMHRRLQPSGPPSSPSIVTERYSSTAADLPHRRRRDDDRNAASPSTSLPSPLPASLQTRRLARRQPGNELVDRRRGRGQQASESTQGQRARAQQSRRRVTSASTAGAAATMTTVTNKSNVRPLAPPFPNGLCGGTLITLPPEQTYGYGLDDNAILTTLAGAGGSLVDSMVDTVTGGDDTNEDSGSGDSASAESNPILLPPRPIEVWLPPTYDLSSTKRHAVLYCHDGQNAIDDESSWTGSSWRLAGALTRLAERSLLDSSHLGNDVDPIPIVVLLPSADGDLLPGIKRRHLEYGDPSLPIAQAHADFVAHTVLPLINSRFRTVQDDPRGVSTIGTSLGGQASFHLLLRHPDKFGGAAGLSPAFQPSTITTLVTTSPEILKTKCIYMDNGGDVEAKKVPWFDFMDHLTSEHWWNPGYWWLDTQLQPGVDAMRAALDVLGVQYGYRKVAGGRHNERAWAQRIDAPLVHLFGRR